MHTKIRFTGAGDSLLQSEWRQPGTANPIAPPAERPVVRRTLGPAALHLGARKASVAQERNRARDIVSAAKQELANTFEDVRFGRGLSVEKLWPLVSGIQASISRHPSAVLGVTRLKDRHEYTYVHSVAVCGLMISLARQMGLPPASHHEIGLAGLLHDIGKARVPTMLLDKPGPLTPDEKDIVRNHALWGYEMLIEGQRDAGSNSRLPQIVLDVCLHHHERVDGTGYPDRKRGEDISIYARMAAICDMYDAMTSARVYKAASSPAEALEYLASNPGKVDAEILRHFSVMIGIFPVGSLVRLRSDRLAVILDDPEGDSIAPAVCPFFCIQTKQTLPLRRTAPGLDPIVGIELPSRWNLSCWPETRAAILAQFSGEAATADSVMIDIN
ncbi:MULTISPECIES: HD-GYP domain-containing protein [unclassified Sphingomonas]|uniref:HD-GYP domain-containing protein n=1 Tax=unclassified Sphingomonas TaxID=196159 RepID=UPI000BCAF870|nr:MAG: hypothetical protein B7Z43_00640 [Sphingomonas sp. 12-62-6]OYX37403.1 MAG: hypothetical protein B7Y98_12485 [Sphingomonas sp. 32-62-10]